MASKRKYHRFIVAQSDADSRQRGEMDETGWVAEPDRTLATSKLIATERVRFNNLSSRFNRF